VLAEQLLPLELCELAVQLLCELARALFSGYCIQGDV
jgi:hypothetical protein